MDDALLDPPGVDSRLGSVMAGRYALTAIQGDSRLGRRYRARDLETGEGVVLQVMYAELAAHPTCRRQFARHARRWAAARHPNLITPLGAGTDGPCRYLVEEAVDCVRLSELIADEGPVPPAFAKEIARAMTRALSAIHRSGLDHGSIAIDRVVVVLEPDGPRIRLLTPDPDAPPAGPGAVYYDLYRVGLIYLHLLTGTPVVPAPTKGVVRAPMQ